MEYCRLYRNSSEHKQHEDYAGKISPIPFLSKLKVIVIHLRSLLGADFLPTLSWCFADSFSDIAVAAGDFFDFMGYLGYLDFFLE